MEEKTFIVLYILIATQSTITDSTSSSSTTPAANTSSTSSFTTSAHTASVMLEFRCSETFIPELNDSSSQAFKDRAKNVTEILEAFYQLEYPSFIRALVLSFRAGSIITKTVLWFNSTQSVPPTDEIVNKLQSNQIVVVALNISSNSTILTASAHGTQSSTIPTTTSTNNATSTTTGSSTATSTLAGSSTASAFNTTTSKATLTTSATPSSAAFHETQSSTNSSTFTTTASQPTASTLTTAVSVTNTSTTTAGPTTKAPTVPEIVADLEFHSSDTFISALNNSESQEFKNRSKLVTDQLEAVYKPKYDNFLRAIVQGFRPGSIITKTQLVFNSNQPVPSRKEISDTLLKAAETGTINPLNIIPQTISVNGSTFTPAAPSTVTTASRASKIELHLLQATCLIIMSKILRLFL